MASIRTKVWDLPIRLFHWLLVATIIFQYVSVEILDNTIEWHFYGGYFGLGLILFRIVWGMVGSYYARFTQFVVSPKKAFLYLFSNTPNNHESAHQHEHLGHNPAGGYSVLVLLSLVLTQAITGLFLTDDIFSEAPYHGVLSKFWEDMANYLHHNVYIVLFVAIALHISAIIFYKLKHKQNLTKAMITGVKISNSNAQQDEKNPVNVNTNWILFIACVALVATVVYVLVVVLPPPPADDYFFY